MSELQPDFRGDPPVSALYREHARDEPSAAGDERIIAAARAAVRAPATVARRTWWQRWRTTLALATTLVLTLTLSLLHERQPADARRETEVESPRSAAPGVPPAGVARDLAAPASAPAAAPEVAAPAAVAGDATAGAGAAAPRAAPRQKASEERSGAPNAAPTTGESGTSPAAADSPRHSDGPSVDRPGVAAVGSALPVAKESGAVPAAATPAPVVAGAEQEAAALGQAAAARKQGRAVAKSRADDGRSADDWLEEIRRLRREGRSVEAAQQLAEFRRAHPGYPLPEEFRQ